LGIGENSFNSKSIEYSTPQVLFNVMNELYNFELDVCASVSNTKCKNYFTKEDDALTKEWVGNCWMNPPFNKQLGKFVLKMHKEYKKYGGIKCALVPVRSNTVWWSKVIGDAECIFINGEVNFNDEERGLWLPMCFLVFGNGKDGRHSSINYRELRRITNTSIQHTPSF
jgi:phage N-6-adenine-methyltransferase